MLTPTIQRMGMIAALGQLGQRQDFARAVALIRHAAETADENSPQGAYVGYQLFESPSRID